MIIRKATPRDKSEIVALYKRSQMATGLPNPAFIPPERLGSSLYARDAVCRYVAVEDNVIVGHALIERANPGHLEEWVKATDARSEDLVELGGAFVEPSRAGTGIWSALLAYRLGVVRDMGAIPVSVTWSVNEHVKKHFKSLGGKEITQKETDGGTISLFIL